MKNVLDFIIEHWATISVLAGAIALRVIPTEKNYDIFKKVWAILDFIIPNLKKGGGKHTLKAITFFVLLSVCAESYGQLNVTLRQGRFRAGVQNAIDTAEVSGNEGNFWYDFVTGRYRMNEGGTNKFWGGNGGGGAFWPLSGVGTILGNTTINSNTINTDIILSSNDENEVQGRSYFSVGKGSSAARHSVSMFTSIDNAGSQIAELRFFKQAGTIQAQFIDTRATTLGLQYSLDYSAGFTDRSLIDRGFANSNYWKTSGTTTISGGATVSVSGFGAAVEFRDNGNLVFTVVDNGGAQIGRSTQTYMGFNTGAATIAGTVGLLNYTTDKSGSYTPRSVVDKAYADTKLDGTMVAGNIPYGVDANTLTQENAFQYMPGSNTLVVTGTAGTTSTSVSGGQIQLDIPASSDQVIISNSGVAVTGLPQPYEISSDSGLELINDITLSPSSSSSQLYFGEYTPTLTAVANLSAATGGTRAKYYRIGNLVTVIGTGSITVTSPDVVTDFTISLPIATDFDDGEDCYGLGNAFQLATDMTINADVSTNTATARSVPPDAGVRAVKYQFTYQIQ